MTALEIIGIIVAILLFCAFILFMCLIIVLGILYEEDLKRAEALMKRLFGHKR